ncbi:MAG: MBL fold metallo-hydrolase [Ignavibacteriota bacterium]
MKVTFWGAAPGEVTGSMHLVEAGGKRYLLDCGLHQGRRKDAERKNRELPFSGSSIDGVVLSHAHIDHSGNLPTLVKNGFSGPIYATPATVDLCNWMLRDTAHIHEKDAEFLNKRREKRKQKGLPGRAGNASVHHGRCRAYPPVIPARRLPFAAESGARPDVRAPRRRPHPRFLERGAA